MLERWKNARTASLLEEFLEQQPSAEASRRAILENVVAIRGVRTDGKISASHGLLISENGYVITAQHCVYEKNRVYIITSERNNHPIEKVCAFCDVGPVRYDVALIKVHMPGSSRPKPIRFYTGNGCVGGRLVTFDGKNVLHHKGSVFSFSDGIIPLAIDNTPGNSGAPIMTPAGELVGIMSQRLLKPIMPLGINSLGVSYEQVRACISLYINNLKENKDGSIRSSA